MEVNVAREPGVDTVHWDINIAVRSKGSQHTDRQQQTPPTPPPASSAASLSKLSHLGAPEPIKLIILVPPH